MTTPHYSVLSTEILPFFSEIDCRVLVDGTLGAGGHSKMFLENIPNLERLIGIDQDPQALQIAGERLSSWGNKILLKRGNFGDLSNHLTSLGLKEVDAILLDIGVSSMQIDQADKGFSFMRDGPLDMRMDPDAPLSALQVINEYSEEQLGKIFREYGEEKLWRAAAKMIVKAREKEKILTTKQLSDTLMPLLGWKRAKGSQPMALVFQALRIFVNGELDVLENVVPQAIEYLRPGGRLAIITFHSLEDRLVKNAFRLAASDTVGEGLGTGLFLEKKPTVRVLTKKPVLPSEREILENPRSRSAKLRVIEKI